MIWTVASNKRDTIMFDDEFDNDYDDYDYDDRMDGDFDSGMASAGFGMDEDYGCFSDD